MKNCLFTGKGDWRYGLSGSGSSYNLVSLGECKWAWGAPRASDIIKDGYYLVSASTEGDSYYKGEANMRVYPITDAQLTNKAAYPTLDFVNVWEMTSKGPRLRNVK